MTRHFVSHAESEAEANLERARREIQQLRTDREVAVEKKDKQILQLKTLMAKFKKVWCDKESVVLYSSYFHAAGLP